MTRYYTQIRLAERVRRHMPRVHYLDVVLNGQHLSDIDGITDLDVVSSLNYSDTELSRRTLLALTLEDATSNADGTLLYVCPLCADIGCGAVQIRISRSEHEFEWTNFSYVNGYEDPMPLPIGPFKFEVNEYLSTMRDALLRLGLSGCGSLHNGAQF